MLKNSTVFQYFIAFVDSDNPAIKLYKNAFMQICWNNYPVSVWEQIIFYAKNFIKQIQHCLYQPL